MSEKVWHCFCFNNWHRQLKALFYNVFYGWQEAYQFFPNIKSCLSRRPSLDWWVDLSETAGGGIKDRPGGQKQPPTNRKEPVK